MEVQGQQANLEIQNISNSKITHAPFYNTGHMERYLFLMRNLNNNSCSSSFSQPTAAIQMLQNFRAQNFRWPGGTISQFHHPFSIGYGLLLSELKDENQNFLGSHGCSDGTKSPQLQMEGVLDDETCFDQSAIEHMVALCSSVGGANINYVANIWQHFARPNTVLPGHPEFDQMFEETMDAINYFTEHGNHVISVELGNELYFCEFRNTAAQGYNSQEAYVQDFLSIAREYASRLTQHFEQEYQQDIPIAVPFDAVALNSVWNQAIMNEPIDRFSLAIHPYFDTPGDVGIVNPTAVERYLQYYFKSGVDCDDLFEDCIPRSCGDTNDECVWSVMSHSDRRYRNFEHLIQRLNGRSIMITEVNFSKNWELLENSLYHTFVNALYLYKLVHFVNEHPEYNISMVTIHNLLGKYAGSIDNAFRQNLMGVSVSPSGHVSTEKWGEAEAMQLLNRLAQDEHVYPVEQVVDYTNHSTTAFNCTFNTYYSSDIESPDLENLEQGKFLVYWANSSGKSIDINLTDLVSRSFSNQDVSYSIEDAKVEFVSENFLGGHANTGIQSPDLSTSDDSIRFSLPKFSLGYFEIQLSPCEDCEPTSGSSEVTQIFFDGQDDIATISDGRLNLGASPFTLSFEFNPEDVEGRKQTLVFQYQRPMVSKERLSCNYR